MENKSKTIICDIDGCISYHDGDICNIHKERLTILPGVRETFREWDRCGYNIILLTGRRESVRKNTEEQLSEAGIFYDQLIMGVKNGVRVLINDKKLDSITNTAFAINLNRNKGMKNLSVEENECGANITPWGKWEVLLDAEKCKVKRITINPGQAPSYQYHFKREEYWVIVCGEGEAILDDTPVKVSPSQVIFVPIKMKHRLRNTGSEPLIFIETQLGEYFGEDDIVRLSDDYGRI